MDRYNSIKRSSLLGIFGNLFLLIIKFTIGMLSGSQAMIADSANSAGDIFASLMTTIGNKISSVPKDDSHNFGHGKAEYIFSLFIGLSMIVVAFKLIYNSVVSFFNPSEVQFPFFLILVCIITILVKLLLFFYTKSIEKKYKSLLLKANKEDHRNDCIVSAFTLISVVFNMNGIYFVDGIVGIGISIWICFTGIKIFIESYNVLMDKSIDENTKDKIFHIINEFKDIQKIDHLTSTPVGYKYLVSVTIYIDGNMSTFNSHHIADELEKKLNKLDNIYLAIIHVNPA